MCNMAAKSGAWTIGQKSKPNIAAIAAERLSVAPMMDGTGISKFPIYCQCFAVALSLML